MARQSAGLVVFRRSAGHTEVLLAHPGGPFWRGRDKGAWMIVKGEVEAGEDPLAAARREFREETGLIVDGPFHPLQPVVQKGGKRVAAWVVEADLDLAAFAPGEFELEWPPRSGRLQRFPEIDRLRYFAADEALAHVLPAQAALIAEALVRAG